MVELETNSSNAITQREFTLVSRLVYEHCGINLHEGKRELVQARLSKRMRDGGFTSVSDYLDHVLADASGREFELLIDAISTNLTTFFRENRHFEYLRSQLLPELLQRKRGQGSNRIRAWSAGCSSGEEPYSLGIVLLDAIPSPREWDIKILATDISTRVLQSAQEGIYPKARLKDVPIQQKTRFFLTERQGHQTFFRVAAELKDRIAFRHLNLMAEWPFTGPFDFIFCRNVMIYFDKPTQQKLVNRFWSHLEKGGVLFTGHSESLTGVQHKFSYVEPTIYAK